MAILLSMTMTTTTTAALLLYAGLTLLLVAIAAHRLSLVLRGLRRPNSFSPWGTDVSPWAARLCRAHANCVENLPVFAAVVLASAMAGRLDLSEALAGWIVAARLLQSGVHLLSVSGPAVGLRFVFMAAQIIIFAGWVAALALGAGLQ